MVRTNFVAMTGGVVLSALSAAVSATPTAGEINDAVSGATYQGSMTQSAFVEYYAPDGSIRGEGYSGQWRVEDGRMCFQYGSDPESCWHIELNGPAMTLIKDGAVDGAGMLIQGNPNEF